MMSAIILILVIGCLVGIIYTVYCQFTMNAALTDLKDSLESLKAGLVRQQT